MLDFDEALRIATHYVAQRSNTIKSSRGELVIDTAHIIEKKYGWIFRCNTARFLKTGEFSDMLLGAGPILVRKKDGAIHQFWSGAPIENQLKEYEQQHGLDKDK